MKKIKNYTLIIGGTSGLGLEIAQLLTKRGYNVIICGRRDCKYENLNVLKVDIQSDKSVEGLFHTVQNDYGCVSGIVFSAGITTQKKDIEQFDENIFHNIINTNVTGLLRILKYFSPNLRKVRGRIVVINSLSSRTYSQFSGLEYTISKTALSGLVRQLAIDFSDDGILINSVFPSMTRTPMLEKSIKDTEIEKLKHELPLKKLAEPFDTARAVEFLISKENKYVTGSGIDVSGGQYLNG
tara:strand:- start:2047 stop:2766 length:720 start_codon:yes stop_codon:yes gene_type:complete